MDEHRKHDVPARIAAIPEMMVCPGAARRRARPLDDVANTSQGGEDTGKAEDGGGMTTPTPPGGQKDGCAQPAKKSLNEALTQLLLTANKHYTQSKII